MVSRMRFGYAILYVADVEQTVAFYERAFGFERKFVAPGEYGELRTGETTLAFAARTFVQGHFSIPVQSAEPSAAAPPVEIALVTDDVQAAYDRAVAAGATEVTAPAKKSWGQIVGYVRDNNGFLLELCTPVA
jgi:lactoylglutathione lyase